MPMGYVWSLLSHIQPRATASPNLLLCLDFWILSTESLNLQWQNQFSDIHLASPSLAFSLQSIQSDIYFAMIPDWDCNTKRFWSGASAWHKTNTYLKKVNTYLKPKVLIFRGTIEPIRMTQITRVVRREDTCDSSSMANKMPDNGAFDGCGSPILTNLP